MSSATVDVGARQGTPDKVHAPTPYKDINIAALTKDSRKVINRMCTVILFWEESA